MGAGAKAKNRIGTQEKVTQYREHNPICTSNNLKEKRKGTASFGPREGRMWGGGSMMVIREQSLQRPGHEKPGERAFNRS